MLLRRLLIPTSEASLFLSLNIKAYDGPKNFDLPIQSSGCSDLRACRTLPLPYHLFPHPIGRHVIVVVAINYVAPQGSMAQIPVSMYPSGCKVYNKLPHTPGQGPESYSRGVTAAFAI